MSGFFRYFVSLRSVTKIDTKQMWAKNFVNLYEF